MKIFENVINRNWHCKPFNAPLSNTKIPGTLLFWIQWSISLILKGSYPVYYRFLFHSSSPFYVYPLFTFHLTWDSYDVYDGVSRLLTYSLYKYLSFLYNLIVHIKSFMTLCTNVLGKQKLYRRKWRIIYDCTVHVNTRRWYNISRKILYIFKLLLLVANVIRNRIVILLKRYDLQVNLFLLCSDIKPLSLIAEYVTYWSW